jgi:Zn-dependent metalloprotease
LDDDRKPDVHFNSTILSHAYYLFVQDVGHDRAGNVLQYVPFTLSPKPTFKQVAQGFHQRAGDLYGDDVAVAAANAFAQVGLPPVTHEEPDCGPIAC